MQLAPEVYVSWMDRPRVAKGGPGQASPSNSILFDAPSMQPWSAQSKPCEGVRASKEMNLNLGGPGRDNPSGASSRFTGY